MLPDISNPFYLIFGAAFFTLLTRIPWPKIKLQTERRSCNGIQVTDVMLTISEHGQRGGRSRDARPKFECSIYIVWKNRKD